MSDYYQRWFQEEVIDQFSDKKYENFFKSEINLLNLINTKISSVLDIGCASGRYYELVKKYFPKSSFSGIDIVEKQILAAKNNYPNCFFKCANVLKIKKIKKYDLVNATGVVQHEPEYNKLINLIINKSNHYALFDLKVIKSIKDISDIKESYCGDINNQLLYNLIGFEKFYNYLLNLNYVSDIYLYGYETKINSRTVVPKEIKNIYSCGVLIKKSKNEYNVININFKNRDISKKILF